MEIGLRGAWGPSVNLYMSDDLFATTPKVMLESGNTIMKTEGYFFFAQSHPHGNVVKMHVSSYKTGFTHILEAQLPDGEVNFGHSFTIIDSSEDTVFLFLENHGLHSPFGSLYVSDETGQYYSLSLKNVIKGTQIDFEKVNSLDGTFIANVYAPNGKKGSEKIKSKAHSSKLEIGEDSSQSEDHTPEVEHEDFSEEEIVAEHARKEQESHI